MLKQRFWGQNEIFNDFPLNYRLIFLFHRQDCLGEIDFVKELAHSSWATFMQNLEIIWEHFDITTVIFIVWKGMYGKYVFLCFFGRTYFGGLTRCYIYNKCIVIEQRAVFQNVSLSSYLFLFHLYTGI